MKCLIYKSLQEQKKPKANMISLKFSEYLMNYRDIFSLQTITFYNCDTKTSTKAEY